MKKEFSGEIRLGKDVPGEVISLRTRRSCYVFPENSNPIFLGKDKRVYGDRCGRLNITASYYYLNIDGKGMFLRFEEFMTLIVELVEQSEIPDKLLRRLA